MSKISLNGVFRLKIHMLLGHDLLIPHEDSRVMKEASSLSKVGHDVTILCWSKRLENVPETAGLGGFKMRRIFQDLPSRKSWIGSKLPAYMRLKKMLVEISSGDPPDIVYCHDLETLPIGRAISKRTSSRLIYDSHEDWPQMESMYSKGWGKFTGIIENRLLKHVDLIVTVNDILWRKFSQKNIPIAIVMNCATADWASKRRDKSYSSSEINELRIAYWGGVAWRKGLKIMIDIADILRREGKPVKFNIFGTGPDLDMIRKEIIERGLEHIVELRGNLSHDALSEELSDFDFCYALHLPTGAYIQSTPVKLLEGLALGIPFIGNSEFPSVAQIVEEYDCGLLSRYDATEAASVISSLLDSQESLIEMRRNAREAFDKKYNWESQAENLIAAVEKLRSMS